MVFAAGFCFGFACCAVFAAGCFMSYRLWLQHWLTTDSSDVKVVEHCGQTYAQVRIV